MSLFIMRGLVFCTALLFCATLLGCTISDETEHVEQMQHVRASLRAQRYHETLTLMNNIDKDMQESSETHLMKGLIFFKLEDYRLAVQSLEKAQPTSMTLRAYIVYLYLLLGDAAQARALSDVLERQYGRTPEIFILKGNISLKEHAYPEAQSHFRTALAMDKSSIKAYIGLANSYLLERQFLLAEENYLKAVLLANQDTSPYLALVNYYIVTQRYHDAEQTVKLAARAFPKDFDLLLALSNLYTRMGKTLEALELLNRLLRGFPQSDILKVRIIRQYFKLARLEEAHQLIQSLLSRDSESYYGLILLGEYYLRKNDFEQALFSFENAARNSHNSYIVNYYLGVIHLINNHLRMSIQLLERSIDNYPGFIPSHLLLSCIYLSFKENNFSSEHASLVLQLDPGNVTAHLVNGISLYFQGSLREARYEFEAVQSLAPQNTIVQIFKSLISLEQGNVEEFKNILSRLDFKHIERLFLEIELFKIGILKKEGIEKKFEEYIKTSPNYLVFLLVGNFYKEQRNFVKAAEYFQKAIAADGNSVTSYYHLAEVEARTGDKSTALVHLQKAIEINPYFVKAYRALGSLYEEEKDYLAARSIYNKGLRYAPEDSTLLNNLAWINLVHFADKAGAYLLLRKAINLAPDDPDIQDSLGWWYYLNNDYHQAIALLKQSVQATPDNPLFRYHLGMASLKAGEERLALSNLKKALQLGIEKEYKAQILEIVK